MITAFGFTIWLPKNDDKWRSVQRCVNSGCVRENLKLEFHFRTNWKHQIIPLHNFDVIRHKMKEEICFNFRFFIRKPQIWHLVKVRHQVIAAWTKLYLWIGAWNGEYEFQITILVGDMKVRTAASGLLCQIPNYVNHTSLSEIVNVIWTNSNSFSGFPRRPRIVEDVLTLPMVHLSHN